MNKDIKALISIYTILILSLWIVGLKHSHNKEIESLKQEMMYVKKIAIEINNEAETFRNMVHSLNEYADSLEGDLNEYKYLENLKKDLAKSTAK